ncbi:MAG: hypothetical protein Q4C63_05665 [Eubacteriales bacterium]|nr:hypothetical protein [Eubacteriales bacterium]
MRKAKSCRAGKKFTLLITVLSLAGGIPQTAVAAYSHGGTAESNAFSLMAVLDYEAELRLHFLSGKGEKTEVFWYERTGETERVIKQEVISPGAAGKAAETSLTVQISASDGEKRYRCELKNEAGTIRSECFVLRVSENGSSVLCEREKDWQTS